MIRFGRGRSVAYGTALAWLLAGFSDTAWGQPPAASAEHEVQASGERVLTGGERVLTGGKIVTVDPQFRIAEAMRIRGNRIVAVGSTADILRGAAADAIQVDLGGRTVLPELIDSHVHAPAAAVYEFDHPQPTMNSIADVLAYLAARTQVVPAGQWIRLQQVFVTRTAGCGCGASRCFSMAGC